MGVDGTFSVFSIVFRGRVRVTVVIPKEIWVRVPPKLGSSADVWPKSGLILAHIRPKALNPTPTPIPKP